MSTKTWIRFGELPTAINPGMAQQDPGEWNLRSRNHASGSLEYGVSVYEGRVDESGAVWLDMTKVDAGSALFVVNAADIWEVTARRVTVDDVWDMTCTECGGVELDANPTGADGEPLVWVRHDGREQAQRRINATSLHVLVTEGGEWIDYTQQGASA